MGTDAINGYIWWQKIEKDSCFYFISEIESKKKEDCLSLFLSTSPSPKLGHILFHKLIPVARSIPCAE